MRLIDADKLKEAVVNNFYNLQAYFPKDFIEEIDNAPTVEPEKVLVANVTFDKDKLKEIVQTEMDKIKIICNDGLVIKSEERPQGEWKFKKFDEETGISNSEWCPFCGKPKAQVYNNFCGNCGTDMRGEKENEST